MKEDQKKNLSPEQIKRQVLMQLAELSKTLKKETRALPLNFDQHDRIASIIKIYDQTMQNYMIACDTENSVLNTRIQELQEAKRSKPAK